MQVAKEKAAIFESSQARGAESSLPTRTPIADVLAGYVEHLRASKTAKMPRPTCISPRHARARCATGSNHQPKSRDQIPQVQAAGGAGPPPTGPGGRGGVL